MGLLDLIAWPITAPIKGVTWIASKVLEQAEEQLYDEKRIQTELIELSAKRDLDEISEEEYERAEGELLARLEIAKQRKQEEGRAE